MKKEVGTKREEAKNRIEAVRQEAQEKTKSAREEFKKKLAEVKDARKRQTAERLEEQLNRLNKRWTDHFTNVLNRLEEILAKIELRAKKAETNGHDVAIVKTAIETARAAIKTAGDAVVVQAAKVYTVKFESESKLRETFKTVKEQLHKDLAGLRDGAHYGADRQAEQRPCRPQCGGVDRHGRRAGRGEDPHYGGGRGYVQTEAGRAHDGFCRGSEDQRIPLLL